MPRAKGRAIQDRFDRRYTARVKLRCEIPEVRNAIEAIRLGAGKLYEEGYRFRPLSEETFTAGWHGGEPFFSEVSICRSHGINVSIESKSNGELIVNIQLTTDADQEGLTARLARDQSLLAPAEHDLWEIKRDAPTWKILEDLEVEKKIIDRERANLNLGTPARARGINWILRGIEIVGMREPRRQSEGEPSCSSVTSCTFSPYSQYQIC